MLANEHQYTRYDHNQQTTQSIALADKEFNVKVTGHNDKILLLIDHCMTAYTNIMVQMKHSQLKGRIQGNTAYNCEPCIRHFYVYCQVHTTISRSQATSGKLTQSLYSERQYCHSKLLTTISRLFFWFSG